MNGPVTGGWPEDPLGMAGGSERDQANQKPASGPLDNADGRWYSGRVNWEKAMQSVSVIINTPDTELEKEIFTDNLQYFVDKIWQDYPQATSVVLVLCRPKEVIQRLPLVIRGKASDAIAYKIEEGTPPDDGKDPAAKALGKKGGAARAKSLTPERKAQIAKKAADKRWKK